MQFRKQSPVNNQHSETRLEHPKKILVIENDEVVVLLISHVLTRQSYVVHTTLDALEAAELISASTYDAILLDPKVRNGGIELLRKIQAADPGLLRKVILVTGTASDSETLDEFSLHAVVRKPFEVGDLIETVRACVSAQS